MRKERPRRLNFCFWATVKLSTNLLYYVNLKLGDSINWGYILPILDIQLCLIEFMLGLSSVQRSPTRQYFLFLILKMIYALNVMRGNTQQQNTKKFSGMKSTSMHSPIGWSFHPMTKQTETANIFIRNYQAGASASQIRSLLQCLSKCHHLQSCVEFDDKPCCKNFCSPPGQRWETSFRWFRCWV